MRFLRARGADDAEDLVQDVWVRLTQAPPGPIGAPIAYLYAIANRVMIDRFRSAQSARRREAEWSDASVQDTVPSHEGQLVARDEAAKLLALLDRLGSRASTIFRLHRIEGETQANIAAKLGISISTVESDLRNAYRAIHEWRLRRDKV